MRIVRSTQPGAVRVAQPQHLALDRAHRDAAGRALEPRRVRARGDQHGARADDLAVRQLDAGDALAVATRARRRACARARAAGARAPPRPSAATSRRGSTEWSPATSSASRTVGASAGSARRARGRQQPLDVEPERAGGTRAAGRAPRPRRGRARRPACRSRRRPGSLPEASASSRAEGGEARGGAQARARAARPRRTAPRRPARACRRRRARRPARRRRARRRAGRAGRRATRSPGRSARRRRRRRPAWPAPPTLQLTPSLRRHDPDQVRRSAPRWRPLSPIAGSRMPQSVARARVLDWTRDDPARAHRLGPPVPGLRRAPARVPRRGAARRRRRRPAARQGARRRRARSRPRASSAPPPTPPARCSSSTTGPTSSPRAAPTACTSARTTAASPPRARAVGPDRIVGRSTHAPDAGRRGRRRPRRRLPRRRPRARDADQARAARPPGWSTSRWAAANVTTPWFAIGGLDAENVGAVTARGARRIVVVRAITEAADPEAAARALRAAAGGARWGSAAVSDGAARRRRAPAGRRRRRATAAARGYARGRERDAAAPRRARAARARRAAARA